MQVCFLTPTDTRILSPLVSVYYRRVSLPHPFQLLFSKTIYAFSLFLELLLQLLTHQRSEKLIHIYVLIVYTCSHRFPYLTPCLLKVFHVLTNQLLLHLIPQYPNLSLFAFPELSLLFLIGVSRNRSTNNTSKSFA